MHKAIYLTCAELHEAAAVCDVTDFTLDDEFDCKNKWYFLCDF